MGDDKRRSAIESAKATGQVVLATGLNLLLPGAGPLAVRLGQHVVDRVTASRLAKLEDFHRRVFEGDVSDDEITDRFEAMSDGDFQHLLVAMLGDIEAEKVEMYSTVYIHLVENGQLPKDEKRSMVLAVSQLRSDDLCFLAEVVADKATRDVVEGDCTNRLTLLGAIYHDTELVSGAMFDADMGSTMIKTTRPTELGKRLVVILKKEIESLQAKRRSFQSDEVIERE